MRRLAYLDTLTGLPNRLMLRESLARANTTGAMLAQMTMGLYYGQVNHQLAFGLPFEVDHMRSQMRGMLELLLKSVRAGE